MSDTLIVIISIGVAAVLLFVFPLMTMADRTDDVSQLVAQSALTSFVDKVASTGKISQEDIDELDQQLASTGNLYEVEMETQIKDSNLGKKVQQAQADKIGENVYYTVYTAEIEGEIEENRIYYLKEGDIFTASYKNTNQTIVDVLNNFFYLVSGNENYSNAGEKTAMVTADGN